MEGRSSKVLEIVVEPSGFRYLKINGVDLERAQQGKTVNIDDDFITDMHPDHVYMLANFFRGLWAHFQFLYRMSRYKHGELNLMPDTFRAKYVKSGAAGIPEAGVGSVRSMYGKPIVNK